ncbi:MAG: hypothetical protein ABSF23_02640 [Terracidiphilus sp.]|jgi:hypothetical protein
MQDAYKLALASAREEHGKLTQEMKALNFRVSQLEALIAQLDALIKSATPVPGKLFEVARIVLPEEQSAIEQRPSESPAPLWKAIIASLAGKKDDFTVPDVVGALERTGRFINSPNKKAIVRNALKQRPDKFQKLRIAGHYRVREPEEMKNEEGAIENEAT